MCHSIQNRAYRPTTGDTLVRCSNSGKATCVCVRGVHTCITSSPQACPVPFRQPSCMMWATMIQLRASKLIKRNKRIRRRFLATSISPYVRSLLILRKIWKNSIKWKINIVSVSVAYSAPMTVLIHTHACKRTYILELLIAYIWNLQYSSLIFVCCQRVHVSYAPLFYQLLKS